MAVLVISLAGSITSMAEYDTPTRLNNFTGQAVVGGKSSANPNEISVLSNCIYDTQTHLYTIVVDEEKELYIKSTVADGMVTNYSVSIETNITEDLTLLRNGSLSEETDLSRLKHFGHYILQYQGKKVLEFRILEEYATIKSFHVPKGFRMADVTVDGVPAEFDHDGVQMNAEGLYEVSYICDATDMLYSFTTIVDRTAPVLELKELDKNGRSARPVDISDREPFSVVKVTIDGEEAEVSDLLTQNGEYILTISDRAGNYNTYHFEIGTYLNGGSIAFTALLLAVVCGIIVYVIVSSKRFKVY